MRCTRVGAWGQLGARVLVGARPGIRRIAMMNATETRPTAKEIQKPLTRLRSDHKGFRCSEPVKPHTSTENSEPHGTDKSSAH
jgi:hypothetical protein